MMFDCFVIFKGTFREWRLFRSSAMFYFVRLLHINLLRYAFLLFLSGVLHILKCYYVRFDWISRCVPTEIPSVCRPLRLLVTLPKAHQRFYTKQSVFSADSGPSLQGKHYRFTLHYFNSELMN